MARVKGSIQRRNGSQARTSIRHRARVSWLETDVFISGASISGLTAAVLLARAGRRVAVLPRPEDEVEGQQATGVLSHRVGEGYARITRESGLEVACALARSTTRAIAVVRELGREMGGCKFRRIPGYLFSTCEENLRALRDECEAARAAGLKTEVSREIPLPVRAAGGVFFPGEAEFSPKAYLSGLQGLALGAGCRILSRAGIETMLEGDPCIVRTRDGNEIRATSVFLASQQPFMQFPFLAKLALRQRHAVMLRKSHLSPSISWNADAGSEVHASSQLGFDTVFVDAAEGGPGHVGPLEEACRSTSRTARDVLSVHCTEVMDPQSGLPLIGWRRPNSSIFVATGFGSNVLTLEAVAALSASDAILGRFSSNASHSQRSVIVRATGNDVKAKHGPVPAPEPLSARSFTRERRFIRAVGRRDSSLGSSSPLQYDL